MKICFLWWFDQASWVYPKWRDGLRSAMEIVGKKHDVTWMLGKELPKDEYDFILLWDDSNSEFFSHIDNYKGRKGLCLTTDPHNIDNLKKLDVVFCESEPVYQAVRSQGIRAIKAFGTDTNFFSPDTHIKKDLDFFYPATFSPWKRQSEIAYLGKQLKCIGTMQPDGSEELEACRRTGVDVEIGYFGVKKIRDLYRRTKNVIIPAIHGSERTILEAMSSDILPVILHPDVNAKAYSYIEEFRDSGLESPREFVLENYSHYTYADRLLRGIES